MQADPRSFSNRSSAIHWPAHAAKCAYVFSLTTSVSGDELRFALAFFSPAAIETLRKSSLREGGPSLAVQREKKNQDFPLGQVCVSGDETKGKKKGQENRAARGCEKRYSPMTLTRRWGSTIQGQNTEKPHEYPPASLENKRSHTPWRFSPLFVGFTFLAEACSGRHFCSILILRFISLATFCSSRRSKMQRSVAKEGKQENDTLHLATFSQLPRHNDKLLARTLFNHTA